MSLLKTIDTAPSFEPVEKKPDADRLIAGDPVFRTWAQDSSRSEPVRTGIWEATPGTSRSIKGDTFEFCYILEGVVELTEEGGTPVIYRGRRQLRDEARLCGRLAHHRDGAQDLRGGGLTPWASASIRPPSPCPAAISSVAGWCRLRGRSTSIAPRTVPPSPPAPLPARTWVDAAVESARKALKDSGWGGTRPRDRVRALHRWADLMDAHAEELGRLEAVASTRPIRDLMAGDLPVTIEQIRFFAEFADKEGGDLVPTADDSLGLIMTEPYGVVGAITPWNFPSPWLRGSWRPRLRPAMRWC